MEYIIAGFKITFINIIRKRIYVYVLNIITPPSVSNHLGTCKANAVLDVSTSWHLYIFKKVNTL